MQAWVENLGSLVVGVVVGTATFLLIDTFGPHSGIFFTSFVIFTLAVGLVRVAIYRRRLRFISTLEGGQMETNDQPPSYEAVTSKPPPYGLLFSRIFSSSDRRQGRRGEGYTSVLPLLHLGQVQDVTEPPSYSEALLSYMEKMSVGGQAVGTETNEESVVAYVVPRDKEPNIESTNIASDVEGAMANIAPPFKESDTQLNYTVSVEEGTVAPYTRELNMESYTASNVEGYVSYSIPCGDDYIVTSCDTVAEMDNGVAYVITTPKDQTSDNLSEVVAVPPQVYISNSQIATCSTVSDVASTESDHLPSVNKPDTKSCDIYRFYTSATPS